MLEKSIGRLLRAKDQPQVLSRIQRFRTVSDQPFLNRGTVRRGGLGVSSILRFASELKNMLLHVFVWKRRQAGAAGGKERVAQEPRARARRVEEINGRCHCELARRGRKPVMPQTVLLRW
jgi:hypothetical protein